jgi:hypothetical protein
LNTSSFFPSLLLVAAAGCGAPTERVPAGPDRAPLPYVAPPSAPQVMIAAPADAPPQSVVLGTMSEAERRKILLPSANPIEPFVPAPVHAAAAPSSYAPDGSHRSAVPCEEPSYYGDHDWSNTAVGLLRMAAYTGMGAIIGNQYHEKGQGAAIGAGLALLTWPFFGGGNGGYRW